MEKHTAYYNLLEQLGRPGCPVCGQVLQSLKTYLDSYLYESVNDKDGWNRLVASDGYCARHCGMLEKFSDGLAVSLFYRHLIRLRLKDEQAGKPKSGLLKKAKPEPCPACVYEDEIEAQQLRLLAAACGEEEFLRALKQGDGLCLRHTLAAGKAGAGPAAKEASKKLEALCAELDEFVRKSDHRNQEKMGPEGDSWRRALHQFHGNRLPEAKDKGRE